MPVWNSNGTIARGLAISPRGLAICIDKTWTLQNVTIIRIKLFIKLPQVYIDTLNKAFKVMDALSGEATVKIVILSF